MSILRSPIASPILSPIAIFTPISESGAPPPDDGSIGASLVASLAVPTAAAGARVAVRGEVARSIPAPVLTSAGRVRVAGSLAESLPAPELAAQAATSSAAVTGNLDAGLPVPTLIATAGVEVVGQVAALLSPPTIAASAEVVDAGGVPTDGPAGAYVPQSAADFVALGLPAPLAMWSCQDVSGDLAPAIGSASLVAAGSGLLYAQTIAGWTRSFVGTTGTAGQHWHSAAADFSVTANQGWAWLAYASVATPGASIALLTQGTANWLAQLNSTGRLRTTFDGSGLNDSAGPVHTGITTVRPYLFYRRHGSTSVMGVMSDIRSWLPAASSAGDAITNAGAGFGPLSGNTLNARLGLLAFWKGADADAISSQAGLEALGWTVTW